jgi:hypothetical protein
LTVGAWTKLEAYVKASTTSTSRDGIVRWWVNGVPAGSYTNLNYGAGGLERVGVVGNVGWMGESTAHC